MQNWKHFTPLQYYMNRLSAWLPFYVSLAYISLLFIDRFESVVLSSSRIKIRDSFIGRWCTSITMRRWFSYHIPCNRAHAHIMMIGVVSGDHVHFLYQRNKIMLWSSLVAVHRVSIAGGRIYEQTGKKNAKQKCITMNAIEFDVFSISFSFSA